MYDRHYHARWHLAGAHGLLNVVTSKLHQTQRAGWSDTSCMQHRVLCVHALHFSHRLAINKAIITHFNVQYELTTLTRGFESLGVKAVLTKRNLAAGSIHDTSLYAGKNLTKACSWTSAKEKDWKHNNKLHVGGRMEGQEKEMGTTTGKGKRGRQGHTYTYWYTPYWQPTHW